MFDFTACQSFAGAFDLGMTQAGFRMVHKIEQRGGFGLQNCLVNRNLLGHSWAAQAGDPSWWEPIAADVVIGNPPCSGFSALSAKTFRGIDSPVNGCMHVFQEYVGKVRPQIAVFESVQQAFTQGRPLMQQLRAQLEAQTGIAYDLHHVLHCSASIGGPAIRKRYFWLVSRIPFGIDAPTIDRVPSLADVLDDVRGLGLTWEAQPYKRPPSWWIRRHNIRSSTLGVDGLTGSENSVYVRRCLSLLNGTHWAQGETVATVARRYYETHGFLPEEWGDPAKWLAKGWNLGYQQPHRLNWLRSPRVITGAVLVQCMHPVEDRFLTHREAARIQGFPDDWVIKPLRGKGGIAPTWGKGIPVQSGKWIGGWIRRALEGTPGERGVEIGYREYKHDSTNVFRTVTSER